MNHINKTLNLVLVSLCLVFITACDRDSNSQPPLQADVTPSPVLPVFRQYQVEVVNLTAAQPLSPIALIAHDDSYRAFNLGDVATPGLELLAEGGDNTDFLAEAEADSGVLMTLSASGPLPPGATEVLTISIDNAQATGAMLSAVSMLVNTNDALTAMHALPIDALLVGDSLSLTTISYDSGTEANTEDAGTIPGPVDGGEGFNAARDDIVDEIRGHSGVVTSDDGLATSVLKENHRWDNPVAQITVTRIE